MNVRARFVLGSLAPALAAAPLAANPRTWAAPRDSAAAHATIRGWAEDTWLLLLDREGARAGRLSRAGILQRFHPAMDDEYELDLLSSRFTFSEDYAWYSRENGARYWAGSINHRNVVTGGELKASLSLGAGWWGGVRFTKQESLVLDRNLVRLDIERRWAGGLVAFVEGTLDDVKPNIDLGVGAGWLGERGSVTAAVTLLDAFSDLIFQELGVSPGIARTARDHERLPLALRAEGEVRIGREVRVEVSGAVLLPLRIRAYDQVLPDAGFRQEERFALAAALVEWSPTPVVRVGALAGGVRAVMDRVPLAAGAPADDFRLVERTGRAGVFLLARPDPWWSVEAWFERNWRPERRSGRSDVAEGADYEDRAWSAQATVGFRAPSGLVLWSALDADLRHGVRGKGQVPLAVPSVRRNTRARLDVGWEAGDRWSVVVGSNWDLDGDARGDRLGFDGAHGRFVFYW
ncbi:MAG: hypothetical protein HY704_01740 [Gemmatimonadetes bacterium]|nr:hypothetical protein [Gemmatimonadota bacterium]